MLLIKDIRIVDKYKNAKDSVLIEDGYIKLIGSAKIKTYLEESGLNREDISTIEGAGRFLSPSLVDLHFHLRNPGLSYKQTYEEASKSAIRGGYTTVVAMANTLPVCDRVEIIKEVKEAMKDLPLTVIQAGALSVGLSGTENVDYKKLREQTFVFSDDGKNVDSPEIMRSALKESRELDFIIMDHDEPETENVVRNIGLARETRGRLHFCHISKKESIEAINKAKEEGLDITYEITPHHIFAYDNDYKVNPPMGNSEDWEAIIEAARNNQVDAIGTDHAPHSDEDKANGAPGIANIETSFGMVRKIFSENGISIKRQIELMSNNPSEILGIDNRIKEGNQANLIIYNDNESYIQKEKFATRSKNTPFDKMEIKGIIEYTIVGGKLYDHGQD